MSPHTPESPPRDDGRSGRRGTGRRAIERLRRLGSDIGSSLGALVDDLTGRPALTPATIPVAPAAPRRRIGGER
jgi:hypothetical protein